MTANPRPTSRRLRERPGRQLERTELAWERSTVGLLAAAALLMLRHVEPMWARISLAAADVAFALMVAALGRRRGHRLRVHRARADTADTVPDASREVLLVSAAAIAVAAGTALLIAFQR